MSEPLIHVRPAEGFTVHDHEGNAIPEEGAKVAHTTVIARRIREGLLEVFDDAAAPAPATTPASDDGGGTDGDDDEVDIDAMTAAELKDELTARGVAFKGNASTEALRELLLEAVTGEDE